MDQFTQKLKDTLAQQVDLTFFHDMLAEFSHDNDVSPEEIASALAYLCQLDRPLQVKYTDVKPTQSKEKFKTDRPDPSRKSRHAKSGAMQRYRIEVGRQQGVRPSDIVGAIANEVGMESQYIGHIKLYDEFSTVDLPAGMSRDLLNHLRKVWVRNKPLNISLDGSEHQPKGHNKKDKKDKSYAHKTKKKPEPAKGRGVKAKTKKRMPKHHDFA